MKRPLRSEAAFGQVPRFVYQEASPRAVVLFLTLYGMGDYRRPERQATYRRVAEAMDVAESTVRLLTEELEAIGALRHERGERRDGREGPGVFVLSIPGADGSAAGGGPGADGSAVQVPMGRQLSKEARALPGPSEKEPQSKSATAPDQEALFEAFWKAYPAAGRREKPKARQAFSRALRRFPDVERITAAAAAYDADPNREPAFTKHAANWLNADAWNDPPLESRDRRSAAPDDGPRYPDWSAEAKAAREAG